MEVRNFFEVGVSELQRLENLSGGRDHFEAGERSCDSTRASFREDVLGFEPMGT